MSHILNINEFLNPKSFRYTIDWSLFDGVIETINEEVYVVPTKHANDDRFNPERISLDDIKDLVFITSDVMIEEHMPKNTFNEFIIRDRRTDSPINNNPNRDSREYFYDEDKDENMAIVGDLTSFDKVRKDFRNNNITHIQKPTELEIKIRADRTGEEFTLHPGDYVFMVITCRRKRNFKKKYETDTILNVYDDAIEVIN